MQKKIFFFCWVKCIHSSLYIWFSKAVVTLSMCFYSNTSYALLWNEELQGFSKTTAHRIGKSVVSFQHSSLKITNPVLKRSF